MILGGATRAYVCAQPIDMRKSIDSLSVLVVEVLRADPLSGHVFVFVSRQRNRVKLLVWDRHGFWLLYKRLERGRFPDPQSLSQGLSMAELMAWLEGIDLSSARRLPTVSVTRVM